MSRCDDYCCNHGCNHGCNQGRDCPARVAKVKQRVPKHPKPLRQETSTVYLKRCAAWLLTFLGVLLVAAFVVGVIHA